VLLLVGHYVAQFFVARQYLAHVRRHLIVFLADDARVEET
jgi:hypothetical protein